MRLRTWHLFGLQDPNNEYRRKSGDDGHAANGIKPERLWNWIIHATISRFQDRLPATTNVNNISL